MLSLSKTIAKVKQKVQQAAVKGGTEAQKVHIVAAGKGRSIEQIQALMHTGAISAIGENRVQEFLGKYRQDISFDFIGRLQTNKVKYIIDKVRLIQSVDRENLLVEIDKQAKKHNIQANILMQINTGKEQAKGGIFVDDAIDFASKVMEYDNIILRGVMAVAPIADQNTLKVCFTDAYKVFCNLQDKYKDIDYLSMGMSEDYEIAIECGSNMIRLGRVLFGDVS